MNKEQLINIFDSAKETNMDIAVEITVPGQETTEVIVTRAENLDNKLAFYKKAYDENGVHSMNNAVRIIDAWCIHFFDSYDKKNGKLFRKED